MLTMKIDEEQVVQFVRTAEEGVQRFLLDAAEDLRTQAAMESASASKRVSAGWTVEGGGPDFDIVSNVWFAHFLARGTRAHGPVEADRLVFTVGGDTVFAQFVSGIGADPFHERAVRDTEARVNEILARDLAGVI